MSELAYRGGRATDHHYVINSWVKSDSRTAFARGIASGVFMAAAHRTVAAILARESTSLLCAVLPDDDDAIIGFAAAEPGVVHYCLVRVEYRRRGIASELLTRLGFSRERTCEFSHKPPVPGDNSQIVLPHLWKFNPYRAFR